MLASLRSFAYCLTTGNNDGTSTGLLPKKIPKSAILPEEILRKIFKYYLDDCGVQNKAILNWRLVCSSWKNAVDNYPILMDKLWCTVFDINKFLNSTIARKVKNLRFVSGNCGLSANQEQVKLFFTEIIPNVEGIMFDFPAKGIYSLKLNEIKIIKERMLFIKLMRSAKKLKEMRLASSNIQFLKALTAQEIELVGFKVKCLYLGIQGKKFTKEYDIPVQVAEDFVLSLERNVRLIGKSNLLKPPVLIGYTIYFYRISKIS